MKKPDSLRPLRFHSAPSALLMAILNVTPDSFSDGGRYKTVRAAVKRARQMIADGADIIDIGGESSRPGAAPVSVAEELRRVVPVIKALRKISGIPISIDTYKPEVAAVALTLGATMVNDISGLRNPLMRQVIAQAKCDIVIMHMPAFARAAAGKLGSPLTVHKSKYQYKDVAKDIKKFFQQQIKLALKAGIKRNKIILDPGIGFGKTVQDNLNILNNLNIFTTLGFPILIGASRKSFIGKLTGAAVKDRLPGTLAVHLAAVQNGATILRVHDVAEHRQFLKINQLAVL